MISIIMPVYNEEKALSLNVSKLAKLALNAEIIFVDGGSTDRSIDIIGQYGRIVESKRGRAIQMNQGAQRARNDILLFLHADNIVSQAALLSIEKAMQKNGIVGGCLTQKIDKAGLIYRIIEAQGNIRALLSKVFYGDQGIFVKKNIFFQLGGFPEVPMMEDVLFTKRLRKMGKTIVLLERIFVSARRWEKKGVIKTILRYNLINMAFKCGVPLERISLFYEDIR